MLGLIAGIAAHASATITQPAMVRDGKPTAAVHYQVKARQGGTFIEFE